jgi:hypothetical protein
VVVGRSYEWCGGGNEITKQNGIYIFNKDRTRYNATIGAVTVSWWDVPQPRNLSNAIQPCCTGLGNPLSLSFDVIQSANNAPVTADIDGDNVLELLYSSYDGRVHCWWLDKTEKYKWPITVGTASAMRFASPPVVVDLNNDGRAEIIFSTWTANA